MKVNFEYTYKDYKNYLFRSRLVNNIVLFALGLILYLFFSYNKISLLYLPLVILGLVAVIFLLNLLYVYASIKVNEMLNYNMYGKYTLELTPNKFSITLNNKKTDYKYNQIRKVVETKNDFKLKFKGSREYLIFEKRFFKEDEYNKIINMFKEKSQN
jgi:spore coat polysaccharide biosynthesis protein SpsF (cytidylyltransferase family)